MKFRVLLTLIVLLALTLTAAAQDEALTESFSSNSGVSFLYPAGYTVSHFDGYQFEIADAAGNDLLSLAAGDNMLSALMRNPTSLDDAYTLTTELLAFSDVRFVDEPESLTINDAPALFQRADSPFGPVQILLFTLADGSIAGIIRVNLAEDAGPFEDNLVVEIAATVAYDAEADFTSQIEDVPAGRLTPAQMPPGQIVLYTPDGYSIFSYPDTWELFALTNYVESAAIMLYNGDFAIMAQMVDFGLSGIDLEFIRDFSASGFFSNHEIDLSPEDYQQLTLDDGRVLEYYGPVTSEASESTLIYYIVTLGPGRYGTIQVQSPADSAPESLEADVLLMASSFRLADEALLEELGVDFTFVDSGTPLLDDLTLEPVVLDLSAFEIQEAFCFDRADGYVSSENPTALVTCPAGCLDGSVWGTDIYTDDSSICTAAIHAGAATAAEGGLVLVSYLPGQSSYPASQRNGIITYEWGSWGGSFTVAPVAGP